jgi:membrane protein YdbS with pleckstrin-like domain
MSESKTIAPSRGFPTLGILTILLVLLKALGKITWSWWLVFAPLWVPTAIVFAVFMVILAVVLLAAISSSSVSGSSNRRPR